MVLAYIVRFKQPTYTNFMSQSSMPYGTGSSSSAYGCCTEVKPLLVIADNLACIVEKYPNATEIVAWEGDVDILTKICRFEGRRND